MNQLHYNFVVFNMPDGKKFKRNPNGYYSICLNDLIGLSGIKVSSCPLEEENFFLKLLYSIHNSAKIAKYICLPKKELWFPLYFRNSFPDDKPLCFVIINSFIAIPYLHYLKQQYPSSKIVYLHRDIIEVSKKCNPDLSFNPIIDLEMSIDDIECQKYGMIHFNEFESSIDIPKAKNYPICDVFFAGVDKGRLAKLVEIYDFLENAGIKCFFYITQVKKENQIERSGIIYAKKNMPYTKMLYYTCNSRCVLEINHGNAVGFTSRFLEAVMYGKKLITDNQLIKNSIFYKTENIQVIDNINDIDPSLITGVKDFVDYHYHGEFSPINVIKQIDSELAAIQYEDK